VADESEKDLAKAIAKNLGVKGRRGGWLYRESGEVVCQGWDTFAAICRRRGWIKTHPDTRIQRLVVDWKKVK
jgi:hypothetical protein